MVRMRMSQLSHGERIGVHVFGWLSVALVIGLTITGLWQFFTLEPEPSWFRYQPDSSVRRAAVPSHGVAAAHGTFADIAAVLALLATAWFAYKILFLIPKLGLFAFVLAVSAHITGALIRFNAVKLEGKDLNEASSGYGQLFSGDLEWVATDRYDFSPFAIRAYVLLHVLTIPVLVGAAGLTLIRSRRER